MKICSPQQNRTTRRFLSCASATAFALACTVALGADEVIAPDVPFDIQVPQGHIAFLKGLGVGTQNYACSPSGTGFAWILFTPEATLFSNVGKQITTHFNSPNPDPLDGNTDPRVVAVGGAIRATWQHSRDSSIVWAKAVAAVPQADSIAWLKLEVVGRQRHRWRHADADHLHPAREHRWRTRAICWLLPVVRRRQEGVHTLHG